MTRAPETRRVARNRCVLCGADGRIVYANLPDLLYGTPGEWSLRHCSNPDCGLTWLNPAPDERDIGALYAQYYTHEDDTSLSPLGTQSKLWLALAKPYQAVLARTQVGKMRADKRNMWLGDIAPGRLLDVGCGDGTLLARLRAGGWRVQGQELDPLAAEQARRKHSLDVFVGELAEARFDDATFDAITMAHVIEHAFRPVELLAECRRVLKPGGVLVCVTPNFDSLGRVVFGAHWRGLEPPRHIQIFGAVALARAARTAGFARVDVGTTPEMAQFIFEASEGLRRGPQRRQNRFALLTRAVMFEWRAWREFSRNPNSGEELVMIAKPA